MISKVYEVTTPNGSKERIIRSKPPVGTDYRIVNVVKGDIIRNVRVNAGVSNGSGNGTRKS